MARPPRTRGPRERAQSSMPSQEPSHLIPYMPGDQPDMRGMGHLQKRHEDTKSAPPPVYVVSTFDARPINAVDWTTYSGSNALDTGFGTVGGPYTTGSLFYLVPPGYVAILRDFQILMLPNAGEVIGEGTPIFAANGASNFLVSVGIFVDGNAQLGVSHNNTYSLAFGDLFGTAYVIATEGQLVELRVTGGPGGSNWMQALMSMHGNLLMTSGLVQVFEPGTKVPIPVTPVNVEGL